MSATTVNQVPASATPERVSRWRLLFADRSARWGIGILVVMILLALTAPLWIHPDNLNVTEVNGPLLHSPTGSYPLGTDQDGRSVLKLIIWGSRSSLAVGLIATALTMLLGSAIGILAGHYQGGTGRMLMTFTDWFIVLPSLPLALSLSAVIGQGDASITIAIAVTSWATTARLIRAQTLAVEARPYVERARALGAGNVQIMWRHVLPNVMPLILVSATLTVGGAILTQVTLAFLGLGNPTDINWGSILETAFNQGDIIAGAWWVLIPPGIAILLVVLGFSLTGRAAERVLNPQAGVR